MGRKQRVVDQELVAKLAQIGCTDKEIAFIVGASPTTLKRRCRKALDEGRSQLRRALRAAQVRIALGGSVPMLIWLGKQYLGQRDKQDVIEAQKVEVVEEIVFPTEGSDEAEQQTSA